MYQLWNEGAFVTECKEEIYYDISQSAWWTPGMWYVDPLRVMNVVFVPLTDQGAGPNVVG